MPDILGDRDPNIPDQPTRVSEPSRESQLPKRFYKNAGTAPCADGFQIELDGRSVKTPGKKILSVGSHELAEAIAMEWSAQEKHIDPMTMPLTRLLNTALDGVASDMQAVKEDIIRYAGTDLICYRAGSPDGLIARQMEYWDPLVDWAQSTLGCRFDLAEGVMHVEQPAESIAAFSAHVGMIDDALLLAATHVVMSLTGSATISMAVLKDELSLDDAWKAAHVDEDWNIAEWGEDEEAAARRATRFKEMKAACHVIETLR